MDKKALKEFAVYARNELRNQIALRAQAFGITSEGSPVLTTGADYLEINGKKLDLIYRNSLQKLLKEIETKGYSNVIEEVAYTWFNRLIAIRFMEVHNYLPSKIRVLSSETKGKIDPDILTEYQYTDLPVNKEKVAKSIAKGNRETAFRKLLVAQCNELHEIMPFLFEKVADYTELLLPESLLHADSLINQLVQKLEEDNFEEVEVIGWLYQYYMSERKEQVGGLKNQAVSKENLPIVTQLFTPKWIVQYMVQNSLGKLYDEWKPENELVSGWEYYLKSPNKLPIPDVNSIEDIKIIDPACGSGHILVYAFDLLYTMYLEAGYAEREIPRLILEKNIYGLDIDKRAIQMASFALMMKVQEKHRRFLKTSTDLKLNIYEFVDSENISEDSLEFLRSKLKDVEWVINLQKEFNNSKQLGTLIQVKNTLEDCSNAIKIIESFSINEAELVEQTYIIELQEKLLPTLKMALLLSLKYEVVITNPPYHNKYNSTLKQFTNKYYKEYKSDLYSTFIYRCIKLTQINGFSALMTPFTWMFISSHEKLRKYIIENYTISSLVQPEYHSCYEIADVAICSFVIHKQQEETLGSFIRLEDFRGANLQPIKLRESISKPVDYRYEVWMSQFLKIPESPLSYWITEQELETFRKGMSINDIATPKAGLATGDNNKFQRIWHEVNLNKIGFSYNDISNTKTGLHKWFPCNSGGKFRKWYGNNEIIVNWHKDGEEIKSFTNEKGKLKSRPQNTQYYFKKGITWTKLSSSHFGARFKEEGFIFDDTGRSAFPSQEEDVNFILGIFCSKIAVNFMSLLNPTLSFTNGDIKRIPVINNYNKDLKKRIEKLVENCIIISKSDWDHFENSWNFRYHPFLLNKNQESKLDKCFNNWKKESENQFLQLKHNEEAINEMLINIYELEELTPEVPFKEITIRRADRLRDTKSFLSYCVGLMVGRYSLDIEGLAYAGGEWDASKYQSFQPDQDGIIPLTDTTYFEDDIISRLQELLVIMFEEETLTENLQWLAESLTMKNNETPVERLRRYFFEEFYQDHCKAYQKRPIYWMAESGKKKGFRSLFYLHRYTPETLATMRFSYVQNLQEKLTQERKRLEQDLINPDLKATTKKRYEKQLNTIKAQQDELVDFDKSLAELANQRIALDLDDGVAVNYTKLAGVLAKIK